MKKKMSHMTNDMWPGRHAVTAYVLLGVFVVLVGPARASETGQQDVPVVSTATVTAPPLSLVVNKSTILRLDVPATRISVGNPAIADITPINSREIIVLGKAIGTTNLIIWNKSGGATMMDVKVTPEPVPATPTPAPEQKDSVEVIKGLNKSKMEF